MCWKLAKVILLQTFSVMPCYVLYKNLNADNIIWGGAGTDISFEVVYNKKWTFVP